MWSARLHHHGMPGWAARRHARSHRRPRLWSWGAATAPLVVPTVVALVSPEHLLAVLGPLAVISFALWAGIVMLPLTLDDDTESDRRGARQAAATSAGSPRSTRRSSGSTSMVTT